MSHAKRKSQQRRRETGDPPKFHLLIQEVQEGQDCAPVHVRRQVTILRPGSQIRGTGLRVVRVAEATAQVLKVDPSTTRKVTEITAFPPEQISRLLAHAVHRPPGTVRAWRNPIGMIRSGFLYLAQAVAKVRGVGFCDESEAQALTLRPRPQAPGLPHHRHPMTADEACAGMALSAVIVPLIVYLCWKAAHGL